MSSVCVGCFAVHTIYRSRWFCHHYIISGLGEEIQSNGTFFLSIVKLVDEKFGGHWPLAIVPSKCDKSKNCLNVISWNERFVEFSYVSSNFRTNLLWLKGIMKRAAAA